MGKVLREKVQVLWQFKTTLFVIYYPPGRKKWGNDVLIALSFLFEKVEIQYIRGNTIVPLPSAALQLLTWIKQQLGKPTDGSQQ